MTNTALKTVLIFIVLDTLRLIFVRSAFLEGASTYPFILSISIVSIVFYSLLYGWKYREELGALICKRPRALLIVCLINSWHFGLAGTLYVVSGKYLPAPVIAVILQSIILFAATWEWLFFKEKQPTSFWLLLAGSLIGLLMITSDGVTISLSWHYLIPLAAGFCFSVTDIFSRHYLRGGLVRPEIMAFFRPIGFLLFIPVLLLINSAGIMEVNFDGLFASEILFQIIMVGMLMSLMWVYLNKSYKLTSVTNIAMLSMSKIVLTLILSTIFLRESFNLTQTIGAAIIISCGLIFIYSKKLAEKNLKKSLKK